MTYRQSTSVLRRLALALAVATLCAQSAAAQIVFPFPISGADAFDDAGVRAERALFDPKSGLSALGSHPRIVAMSHGEVEILARLAPGLRKPGDPPEARLYDLKVENGFYHAAPPPEAEKGRDTAPFFRPVAKAPFNGRPFTLHPSGQREDLLIAQVATKRPKDVFYYEYFYVRLMAEGFVYSERSFMKEKDVDPKRWRGAYKSSRFTVEDVTSLHYLLASMELHRDALSLLKADVTQLPVTQHDFRVADAPAQRASLAATIFEALCLHLAQSPLDPGRHKSWRMRHSTPHALIEAEQAIAAGIDEAYWLKGLYIRMTGDPKAAHAWFVKGAELGEPNASLEVGKALLAGEVVKADPKAAWEFIEPAAASGLPYALNLEGYMHMWGKGVRRSSFRAKERLERAIALGVTSAKAELGLIYYQGSTGGGLAKRSEGLRMMREAAAAGAPNAKIFLERYVKE